MQQEPPTTEERLALIESKVADLERKNQEGSDRDMALLYRIDNFIEDLRRVERVQMRAFETLMAGQKEEAKRLSKVEEAIVSIDETLKNHKLNIETLAAGQQQILEILLGRSPRSD